MQEWPWEVAVISLAPLGTITAGWTWLNRNAHKEGGGGAGSPILFLTMIAKMIVTSTV